MKISEVSIERLLAMSPEQKWELICGGIKDEGKSADIALLLGSRPRWSEPRARAAAKLYREGRVKCIVPSGGVLWDENGESLSEAFFMKRILLSEGVPEEAIIMENEATTTRENMIYGALQINRKTHFKTKDIMIVTSITHMQRSLALAKTFLPRIVNISYYPSAPDTPYEECMRDPSRLDHALKLTKGLVDNRIIDDFDIGFALD